jgi:HPr kinase/phosphorylase
MSRGILFLGPSGSGKSHLALLLLSHGGRLIADDVVEVSRTGDVLRGKAPGRIRGIIEIREVGLIDVARAYGPSFVMEESSIDLIVRIADSDEREFFPLSVEVKSGELLSTKLPEISVRPAIDSSTLMAVISECVLKNHMASPTLDALLHDE